MKLNTEDLNFLIKELYLEADLNLSDIPDLDLYMDQVITLFDDKLKHLKRNEDDKILTKTMINNYTKAKILIPPNKKKYSKNHIILLILIYYLKQILSINDIGLLFNNIIKDLSNSETSNLNLEKIYQSFLNIKKLEATSINENLQNKLILIKNETKDFSDNNIEISQMLLQVLCVINEANTYKRIAEKMIDEFFTNYLDK
ncbi:DUF1836 domain-containing protein [Clostridium botulinum]|uniref:DUF1836 domain-containing protein n=1 Tax=Clostridium botulinum C/D str. DC5 TaxID=1443128 RepID=A0A0A0IK04_CLOBO|nr:DUF1836 domain-containing protein [Clostridium botulinum]KEI01542.1 hypothetical protein Z952_11845 [Clostridium botulinum C/D str. BKT75002]KEI07876.1 hypothetical protein Z954_02980 [Clostridium botulinum C/D str. BKT2873]KGM95487.1 hypothetical protein Z956_04660 [Clostridium botulinum D str. CCUG 7971]KGN01228.1 hypothetical protein Z955_01445 [Clostridium botulinum C/D str. DC5]KOC46804.1 hypothetical protein ADU88_11580 [Clostridium botulinum]